MKRNIIVAGNWKMNNTLKEGSRLIEDILNGLKEVNNDVAVVIAPPFFLLNEAARMAGGSKVTIAAQNCHQEEKGAYTGEISASMIASTGASHVILGHSERRQYFGENEEILAQKVNTALKNNLSVIFCVGEPLEVREANNQNEFVGAQLQSIAHLTAGDMQKVILAYEPIWAIGTGKTASADQAQEMHAYLRTQLKAIFGSDTAGTTPILYGGSVNPATASDLFSKPDVDGGLVGGASLKAEDFLAIIKAG